MTTEKSTINVYELTGISGDWTGPLGELQSIQFVPGNSGDTLVVKNASASGPVIFNTAADSASDEVVKYFDGAELQPFIDQSECTLNSGHQVIVIYKR